MFLKMISFKNRFSLKHISLHFSIPISVCIIFFSLFKNVPSGYAFLERIWFFFCGLTIFPTFIFGFFPSFIATPLMVITSLGIRGYIIQIHIKKSHANENMFYLQLVLNIVLSVILAATGLFFMIIAVQ